MAVEYFHFNYFIEQFSLFKNDVIIIWNLYVVKMLIYNFNKLLYCFNIFYTKIENSFLLNNFIVVVLSFVVIFILINVVSNLPPILKNPFRFGHCF